MFSLEEIWLDLLHSASDGVYSVYEGKIAFVLFLSFLVWVSIYDIKHMKVKNYQNLLFFMVGLLLWGLHFLGIPETAFTLGWSHLMGALVGFLLLFIPGMILNYAFGGDIKFVTVMGFWIGPAAILLVLLISVVLQLLVFLIQMIRTKIFYTKSNLPFAPAFALGYLISLIIILLI